MRLVVGLGNAGRKYVGTRHNVGFEVLFELVRRHSLGKARTGFSGEVIDAELHGNRVLLLWPHTLMNRSGTSVLAARDFHKLADGDLLVVSDDFNLRLGVLRFRPRGTAGGQRGLEDVIRRLGTTEVPRLRVGIGPVPERWDPADFVLGRFSKDESSEAELSIVRAADGVDDWLRHSIDYCMNRYNASTQDKTNP